MARRAQPVKRPASKNLGLRSFQRPRLRRIPRHKRSTNRSRAFAHPGVGAHAPALQLEGTDLRHILVIHDCAGGRIGGKRNELVDLLLRACHAQRMLARRWT